MVLMTNTCETCGDGRFTVTHHEAAHRCPVCELRTAVADAESDAQRDREVNQSLRDRITELEDEVADLERKMTKAIEVLS